MRHLVTAVVIALGLLGLTQLFITSAISVVARAFCSVAVVVFAGLALFGLASKFRAKG
jgi:hypothetical protein